MPTFSKNPWEAESLQDFSFLNCPECAYKSKEETLFVSHAIDNHPKSIEFINKVDKPWDKPKKVVRKGKLADSIYFSESPEKKKSKKAQTHDEDTSFLDKALAPVDQNEVNTNIDDELRMIQEELDIVEDPAFQGEDVKTNDTLISNDIDMSNDDARREDLLVEAINLADIVFVEPDVEKKIVEITDKGVYGLFKCAFCDASFENIMAKKMHMKSTHADENGQVLPYACARCNRTLPDPFKVQKNQYCLICEAERFKCAYCVTKFPTKTMRYAHEVMTHTNGNGEMLPLNCIVCDLPCKNSMEFRMHLLSKHKTLTKKETKKLTCPYCDQVFESYRKLWNHKNFQHKEHKNLELKCPEEGCEFVTWNSKLLYNHKMAHHGERKIQCERCGKKFVFQFGLRNHSCQRKVDKGDNNDGKERVRNEIPCPICQSTYDTENGMLSHCLKAHGNMPPGYENKEQFPCPHCAKVFFTKASLYQHRNRCTVSENQFDLKATCMNCKLELPFPKFVWHYKHVHNAIPPGYEGKEQFECVECNSIYFSKDAYSAHTKKVHSIKKKKSTTYSQIKHCPVCKIPIKGGSSKMKNHIGNAHSDHSAFHCRACGKGYGSTSSLYWHENKHKECAEIIKSRFML